MFAVRSSGLRFACVKKIEKGWKNFILQDWSCLIPQNIAGNSG
jgi:hypothetical protein